MTDETEVDWGSIRELARRILERGEPLDLHEETRALLRGGALDVAISPEDAEDALRSGSTATTLLREIQRRMDEGSDRRSRAIVQAGERQDAGDFASARKVLEDVLAVEVVPLFREQAARRLRLLSRLEAVAASGHVEANVSPWGQLRVLARRVQQGKPLELREDLRDFLRRTAPSVAIPEAEADKALESVAGAEALVGKMLERIDAGQQRIMQALQRMMDCREAEDREGALQALRDVLAVEVVPKYRQMAQENLDRYDEPLPSL